MSAVLLRLPALALVAACALAMSAPPVSAADSGAGSGPAPGVAARDGHGWTAGLVAEAYFETVSDPREDVRREVHIVDLQAERSGWGSTEVSGTIEDYDCPPYWTPFDDPDEGEGCTLVDERVLSGVDVRLSVSPWHSRATLTGRVVVRSDRGGHPTGDPASVSITWTARSLSEKECTTSPDVTGPRPVSETHCTVSYFADLAGGVADLDLRGAAHPDGRLTAYWIRRVPA